MSEEELPRPRGTGAILPLVVAAIIIAAGLAFLFIYDARNNRFTSVPDRTFTARTVLSAPGSIVGHAISPGGTSLVVSLESSDARTDLHVGTIGVDARAPLTADPEIELAPVWSPDGQSIAFARKTGDRSEITLVPFRGGSEAVIAIVDGDIGDVDWTGDSIFFTSIEQDGERVIMRVRVESGELGMIVEAAGGGGPHRFAVSPDGSRIALSREMEESAELFVLDLSTGAERQLTNDAQPIHGIAWSEDSIIYSVGQRDSAKLWRITPEGLKVAELRTSGPAIEPSISDDGRRILYQRPDETVLELLEM